MVSPEQKQNISLETKLVAAIGALSTAVTVTGSLVVAEQRPSAPAKDAVSIARTEIVEQTSVAAPGAWASYVMRGLHADAAMEKLTSRIPVTTYAAALQVSNGNLSSANNHLARLDIPPLTHEKADSLGLAYTATPREIAKVDARAQRWARAVQTGAITPETASTIEKIYDLYSSEQIDGIRQKLVEGFYDEYHKNVREAHYSHGVGCNCGPRINIYTLGHKEYWCIDFLSFIRNQAGIPFSGGEYAGRPSWQQIRIQALPGVLPKQGYLMGWFEQNGYVFSDKERRPRPGDIVAMNLSGTGSDDLKGDWHGMMLLGKTPEGNYLLGGGNTGDAVAIREYSPDSPYIISFMSEFPDK